MKATEESILAFDFSLNSISEKMSALSVSESSTSLRMFTSKFDINREIYNSPNSTVYLVNQKLPGALKLVLGHTQSNLLIKEYKILRSLDHPHIIKPLGHEIGVMSDETLAAYLLVPYYKNGEMFDYVKERSGLGELKSHFHFSQI